MTEQIHWLSTKEASERLGITLRSLYRFIDEGELAAYKFGRVIRLKADDVDRYIESCRIAPGDLEHLYPPRRPGGDDEVAVDGVSGRDEVVADGVSGRDEEN